MHLNVFLLVWHHTVLPVNLLTQATGQTLVPVLSLLVDAVMEVLQNLQFTSINLGDR